MPYSQYWEMFTSIMRKYGGRPHWAKVYVCGCIDVCVCVCFKCKYMCVFALYMCVCVCLVHVCVCLPRTCVCVCVCLPYTCVCVCLPRTCALHGTCVCVARYMCVCCTVHVCVALYVCLLRTCTFTIFITRQAHDLTAEQLSKLYPDFEKFCSVRHQLDPTGLFLNGYLRKVVSKEDEN